MNVFALVSPTQDQRLEFLRYLNVECQIVQPREIPDGQWAGIFRYMFTWAIQVGTMFDRNSVDNRWCYKTLEAAAVAFEAWDGTGEPTGWHRHPPSGRRRDENGADLSVW